MASILLHISPKIWYSGETPDLFIRFELLFLQKEIGEMETKRLLIQGAVLFEADYSIKADVVVEDGKVARIDRDIDIKTLPEGTELIEAQGLCLLPGIIDAHTHYHLVSRGTVTADSFAEGSRLAAYGGVTTVIDFSDHEKGKSLAESVEARKAAYRSGAHVDFSLHQGIYRLPQDIDAELEELKASGITAVKIFTTYRNAGYLMERDVLSTVFESCARHGMLVTVHCEDDTYLNEVAYSYSGDYSVADHPVLRPAEAERRAIEMIGNLARQNDMSVYVVHLSSESGLKEARRQRAQGVKMILETTPHYLFLDNSRLTGANGSKFVMTPPLREHSDALALQDALVAGEIDVVATDHCAFTLEQKLESHDVRTVYPGIPGTEEMVSLVHTFAVASSRMSMSDLVRVLSTNPAKYFGIYPRKGTLQVGSDADFVLFDPSAVWDIDDESVHSASGYSAYSGMSTTGRVVMTYLRGRLLMGDDVYLGENVESQFIPSKPYER